MLLVLRAGVRQHLGAHQAAAPLVQQLAAIGRIDAGARPRCLDLCP
jgi:hypothetical protein